MKKTVLLRAPALSKSGYGTHARQIARWLFDRADTVGGLDITTELLNWGQTPWYTDVYAQDGLVGRCLQASSNRKDPANKEDLYDVTLQLQLPNEWCPELGKFNVGITAGVEADRCNPLWIDCVNRMNLVIVPSEFTKQTFVGSGRVTTPIVVVPESFPDAMLEKNLLLSGTQTQALPGFDPETPFNLLVFGQATGGDAAADRKNLPYTLKWLFEAFAGNPKVGIILKTNMGRYSHVDRLICENMLKKLLAEIQKPENPKFYLLHGDMSEEELVGLYKHPSVKALVSLSRGEGFNLPALEAAACGLPVVATGWSAHTEFLGLGRYLKVDYELGNIPPTRLDGQIWVPGARWAMPSEQDFKNKIQRFQKDPSVPRLDWAKKLKTIIQEKYSFSAISQAYTKALGEVL